MKKRVLQYILLSSVGLAVCAWGFPQAHLLGSALFGWGVFSVNLLALLWMASRTLQAGAEDGASAKGGLVLVTLMKLPVIGVALYIGLVSLALDPWFLVSGILVGALLFVVLAYRSQTRSSSFV